MYILAEKNEIVENQNLYMNKEELKNIWRKLYYLICPKLAFCISQNKYKKKIMEVK